MVMNAQNQRGNIVRLEPDDELIREVLGGNDMAYQRLVIRYQDSVSRFIWRIVSSPEDREEVCQDTFVKVYFKLKQYRFEARFTTWLYRIAYRTALSFNRKKKLPLGEFSEDIDSGARSLEAVSDDEQIQAILDIELKKLKLEERSVMMLFYCQDQTVDDIAEIIGRPVP
jgi:RNA polymerase sigma-70 factor (ECF subfamily)